MLYGAGICQAQTQSGARAEKAEGQEQEEAAARMPEEDPHQPQTHAELPGGLGEKGKRFLPGGGGGWLVRSRPSGGGGMLGGAGAHGLAVLGLFPGLRGGPTTGRL